jgi:hypothetical protein
MEKETSGNNQKLISMNKKYKTRDGRSARIICTDMKGCGYSVAALVQSEDCEQMESYTAEGLFWSHNKESKDDLIEVSQYEDWKVDDLIMVRDSDRDKWVTRYFAKVQDGIVYSWSNGYTSYTADGSQTFWLEARKPATEELEDIRSKV